MAHAVNTGRNLIDFGFLDRNNAFQESTTTCLDLLDDFLRDSMLLVTAFTVHVLVSSLHHELTKAQISRVLGRRSSSSHEEIVFVEARDDFG